MRKIYFLLVATFVTFTMNAQTILYSNDFEDGLGDAVVVGSGDIETDTTTGFGNVYHNAIDGEEIRTNYLLLPDTIFGDLQASGVKELSIAFWVNKGTAVGDANGYFYCPLFSAYGTAPDEVTNNNTWPMMICQARGLLQVNCGGWTDFTNEDNTSGGTNIETTAWLDDGLWHYYTATFSETECIVYVDAVVQNSWSCKPESEGDKEGHYVGGLFTNGTELNYICLGGNQAWDWQDVDGAFKYDDLVIYNNAIDVPTINANIAAKSEVLVKPIMSNGKLINEEYYNLSGVKIENKFNDLDKGIYIKKSFYSNGVVTTEKFVKTEK